MTDYYDLAEYTPLEKLLHEYPVAADFLANQNLGSLDQQLPFPDALEAGDSAWLEELGTDVDRLLDEFAEFLEIFSSPEERMENLESLTVRGGFDKSGIPENLSFTVRLCPLYRIIRHTSPLRSASGSRPRRRYS